MTVFDTAFANLNGHARTVLYEQDLDIPEVILVYPPEYIAAMTGLTLGSVARLYLAAKEAVADKAPRHVPDTAPAPQVEALQAFLRSAFSTSELRRFVRYLPGTGDVLAQQLPGEAASSVDLASAAARILMQDGRGPVHPELRQRLTNERPRRVAEIDAILAPPKGHDPRHDRTH